MKISAIDRSFSFEFSSSRILATFSASAPPNIPEKILSELSWENILDSATEGVSGAISSKVLSEILGPSEWERDVSSKLQEIVGKLDTILDEVRNLRVYIDQDQRQFWRERLSALVTTHIRSLESDIIDIRAKRRIDEVTKISMTGQMNDLVNDLGSLAYTTSLDARPEGIPLYAAVQSGLLMLVAARQILGFSKESTSSVVTRFIAVFSQWEEQLKLAVTAEVAVIASDDAYLRSYPHKGALSVGNQEGGGFINPGDPDTRYAVLVTIEGSPDVPFKFLGYELVRYSYRELKAGDFPVFPLYSWQNYVDPHTGFCGGMGQAGTIAMAMIEQLNVKRNSLLDKVERAHKLQLVVDGLASAQSRFSGILDRL